MSARVAQGKKADEPAPRHFLDLADFDGATLRALIASARQRKEARIGMSRGAADKDAPLPGRILALIFEKPSTRTRISFDVGMQELGGSTIMLTGAEMQLGRGESIGDTARVLSRFVDAIMIRTLDHSTLTELADFASVPVINGLTKLSQRKRRDPSGGVSSPGPETATTSVRRGFTPRRASTSVFVSPRPMCSLLVQDCANGFAIPARE